MDILVNGVHWHVGDCGVHEGWEFRLMHYVGHSELFVMGDNGLAFFPKQGIKSFLAESVRNNSVGETDTKQDTPSEWFDEGIEEGATHMIVVCDTFDWEDYPVLVFPNENVHVVEESYQNKNMQKVMEVYNLQLAKQPQLESHRAFRR